MKPVEMTRGCRGRSLLLLSQALLTLLVCLLARPADGARFQNGFRYTNPANNLTSGKISVSFSGNFPGEDPICLIPTAEVRLFPGQSQNFSPPPGFTVSDIVTFWTRLAVVVDENGNFQLDADGNLVFADAPTRISNLDDPPGADPPRFELRESSTDRVYNYLFVGPEVQIGPVQTTVPIVTDGTKTGGVPNLFVAEQDPKTGLPIVNAGAGHCFVPSAVRANEPGEARVLPQFLYTGQTTLYATIEALPKPGAPRPPYILKEPAGTAGLGWSSPVALGVFLIGLAALLWALSQLRGSFRRPPS